MWYHAVSMSRIAIITMLLSTVVGCESAEQGVDYDSEQVCECDEGDDHRMIMSYNICVTAHPKEKRQCFDVACITACPVPLFDPDEWDFE